MVQQDTKTDLNLKNISLQDFLSFGMRDVAYIRPVKIEDATAYAIHAADGTPLSVMETMDNALSAVHQNDLEAVTVQ